MVSANNATKLYENGVRDGRPLQFRLWLLLLEHSLGNKTPLNLACSRLRHDIGKEDLLIHTISAPPPDMRAMSPGTYLLRQLELGDLLCHPGF